jgi:hypothetical protein
MAHAESPGYALTNRLRDEGGGIMQEILDLQKDKVQTDFLTFRRTFIGYPAEAAGYMEAAYV